MGLRNAFRGRRKWYAALGTVAIIAVAGFAFGGHHHHHDPQARADWATKVATRKLDLNEMQRVEFRKIADAYVATSADSRDVAQEIVRETRDLVVAGAVSAGDVSGIADRVKSEFDRRLDALMPALVSFHASLDGDQRAKLGRTLDRVLRRMAN
ncbi:MAG: Spy/CpxP family protein refolding chaperone [Alphaproteobacteria bacterium]|jgi:hypothetical protein